MSTKCAFAVLAGVLSIGTMASVFGASPDKGGVPEIQSALFFPINAQIYQLQQDDGFKRIFARDEKEPCALVGEDGWIGELRGNDALLLSADERQGFYFANGLLRKRLVNGREIPVRTMPPRPDSNAIKALWPPKANRLMAESAPEDYWAESDRFRLWFKNPNLAGGLIAMVALFSLGLLFVRRWPWKAIGIATSLMFLALLIKTESRAAMLAFGFGCALMVLVRIKSLLSWRVWLPMLVCVGLVGGYVAMQKNSSRFTTEMFKEGYSNLSRIPIWLEVPRMMVDAPWGWGRGNSGKAYIRWYQEKSTCLLENLVSGHCTFLVEHGWPVRFAYVFLWALIGIALFRNAMHDGNPMPMAICGAFAFLGMFHPATYAWELWIIPVLTSIAVFCRRLDWRREMTSAKIAGLFSVIMCIALFIGGKSQSKAGAKISVFCDKGSVCINSGNPDVWIVDDDYVLHGGYWWLMGKELRDWCTQDLSKRSIGHTFSIDSIPASCKKLVLVGETCETFCKVWPEFLTAHAALNDVAFLSPSFSAESIPTDLRSNCKLKVIQGSLAARLANYRMKPANLEIVAGTSLYIPEWLDKVTR